VRSVSSSAAGTSTVNRALRPSSWAWNSVAARGPGRVPAGGATGSPRKSVSSRPLPSSAIRNPGAAEGAVAGPVAGKDFARRAFNSLIASSSAGPLARALTGASNIQRVPSRRMRTRTPAPPVSPGRGAICTPRERVSNPRMVSSPSARNCSAGTFRLSARPRFTTWIREPSGEST